MTTVTPAAPASTTPAAPTRAPHFTPAEIASLQADDRGAGRAIVGIMLGIFILGLAGYTAICIWVA